MICWEPEVRYCHRLMYIAIVPFWFNGTLLNNYNALLALYWRCADFCNPDFSENCMRTCFSFNCKSTWRHLVSRSQFYGKGGWKVKACHLWWLQSVAQRLMLDTQMLFPCFFSLNADGVGATDTWTGPGSTATLKIFKICSLARWINSTHSPFGHTVMEGVFGSQHGCR